MTHSKSHVHIANPTRARRVALASLVGLMGLALMVAYLAKDSGWFSLTPPATDAKPNPTPDIAPDRGFWLHASAYSAWATILLLVPVFLTAWVRGRSPGAQQYWLAFWSAAWVAYMVHLLISAFGFFEGDLARMTASSRVSAFWPGVVLAVWWPVDIVLARSGQSTAWVRWQRLALHAAVLILFVGGSVVTGELAAVKWLGGLLLVVALWSTAGEIRKMLRRWASRHRGEQEMA